MFIVNLGGLGSPLHVEKIWIGQGQDFGMKCTVFRLNFY